MKAKQKDIDWYNKYYYKTEDKYLPSWYRFLLKDLHNINKNSSIFEAGSGECKALAYLVNNKLVKEENIYAIDQSDAAIKLAKKKLPHAKIEKGDIYKLKYKKDFFDYIFLMETIEHLENPVFALKNLYKILKPGGKLYISFPNFLNLFWLPIRIGAEKLNKPNWIVLQPIDKIYTTFHVINFCKKVGMKYLKCIGTNYFPPILYKYEPEIITNLFNSILLGHLSFHPILVFKKDK